MVILERMLKPTIRAFGWILACGAALAGGEESGRIRALLARLGDPEVQVREESFGALATLCLESPEAVLATLPREEPDPEVAERLADLRKRADWEVARRRAMALAGGDADLRDAVERLYRDPTPQTVGALARGQVSGGARRPDPAAVAAIAAPFLGHPERQMRLSALGAVGAAGTGAREFVGAITSLLADPDMQFRLQVIQALQRIPCPESAAALEGLLADPNNTVRIHAISGLSNQKFRFPPELLARLLADPDDNVRTHALNALGTTVPDALVPTVIDLSRRGGSGTRYAAVQKLAFCGGDRKAVLAAVAAASEDPDANVRQSVAIVAGKMRDPSGKGILERLVLDQADNVRYQTLLAMGEWCREDPAFVRILAAHLADPVPGVVPAAAQALARVLDQPEWIRNPAAAADWWKTHTDSCRDAACPYRCREPFTPRPTERRNLPEDEELKMKLMQEEGIEFE